MTEAAKRLRGRIGSGTLPDVRGPNISSGEEKKRNSGKHTLASFNKRDGLNTGTYEKDMDTIPTRGHPSKSPAQ
jgi:hypothetical protein